MREHEEIIKALSEISFIGRKNTVILNEHSEILKGVGASMESVFIKKWNTLIDRKDLRIISTPDPKMANEMESMQIALKRNADALHSFKDDYIKQMGELNDGVRKMDLLLQGLFKELPSSLQKSALSEMSNDGKVVDDNKEKKNSSKTPASYFQITGLIALGYALSDIISALPF